jgi:hypothetical protein
MCAGERKLDLRTVNLTSVSTFFKINFTTMKKASFLPQNLKLFTQCRGIKTIFMLLTRFTCLSDSSGSCEENVGLDNKMADKYSHYLLIHFTLQTSDMLVCYEKLPHV